MLITTLDNGKVITDGGSYVDMDSVFGETFTVAAQSIFIHTIRYSSGGLTDDELILKCVKAVEDMVIRTADHLKSLREGEPDRYTVLRRT